MYREERPWGSFTILEEAGDHKVKRIDVKPNRRLSYQSHKKRDEHWTIVQGTAVVVLDDEEITVNYGESIAISRGSKHRIENRSDSPVSFIEVQTGEYFGEDDIIRYQDDYKRT